jgi:hypothetical protein
MIPITLLALAITASAHLISNLDFSWFDRFADSFPPMADQALAMDRGTLLSTQLQIAGVFLGLYFTAIAIAVGSYSSATVTFRATLIEQISQNRYVSLLTFYGVYCALLLLIEVLWLPIDSLNLCISVAVGIASIVGYARLGIDAFFYVAVSRVGQTSLNRLNDIVQDATIDGRLGKVRDFQASIRTTASSRMDTWQESLQIAVDGGKTKHSDTVLLIESVFASLRLYASLKRRIPADSDWYEPGLQFQSELHPDTLTHDLRASGYQAPAKRIPSPIWLESRVLSALDASISSILEDEAYSRVVSILSNYPETVGYFSSQFLIDESMTLAQLGRSAARSLYPMSDAESSRLSLNEGHSIEIIDIRGRAIVLSCVGLANQLRLITQVQLQNQAC